MSTFKMMVIVYLTSFSAFVWSGGLERLFTTAQERQELDKERANPHSPSQRDTRTIPPPLPEEIVFNGLVIRNQGSSTAWVNGSEELFRANFRVALEKREGLSVPIVLSENRKIWLKPGETKSTAKDKVSEHDELPPSIPPSK